jgi:cell volume regulation protein A
MSITSENILLIGSILLLISILVGKTTNRLGVPTLIFFLLVGIMAGSEGIGGIRFDNPYVAQFVGITALNFILFSGGLDTNFQNIKPILWQGVFLSTLGILLTTFSVGLFVHFLFDFSLPEGLLLGAIISSTDAAAVFSILRSKGIALKGFLRPTLELESGSNDPMAYFLTISFTTIVKAGNFDILELLPLFIKSFLIGGAIGYSMGKISAWLINKIRLNSEGVYPVLLLALAVFSYAGSEFLGGNGFLAIYITGLVLGNENFIHKRSMMRFYDGQAWLMQIILFLTLGLLVFPSQVLPVIGMGLLISAFLILVARPIGVFGSLLFFKTNNRSKLFLSWVGLRGAVPIVFATYPMIAGLEKSNLIFNLVFFISVTSVLIQGTTLSYFAKLLHLAIPAKAKRRTATDLEFADSAKSVLQEVVIPEDAEIVGKKIVYTGFPKTAQILLIKRGESYLSPVGSTVLMANDKLFILAEDQNAFAKAIESLKIDQD